MCNEVNLLSFPLCHLKGMQYIRYWPSRRSAWLDIANLFVADEAEVNKNVKKKNEANFQPTWPSKPRSIKVLLYGQKEKFSCGNNKGNGQDGHINQNTGFFILGGVYMTPGRLSRRHESTPVPSYGSTFVYMIPPQNVMPARVIPVVVPGREFHSGKKSCNGII